MATALLAATLTWLGPRCGASAGTLQSQDGVPTPDRWATTLTELGYPTGVTMDQPDGYASLHFELPRDVELQNGALEVHYFASPLLGPYSNMRIYVDGSPRQAVSLYRQQTDNSLTVPLTAADLQQRYLALTVKGSLITSQDRCFDQRINGGFLQILPDTTLALSYSQPGLPSIRGFWDTLGHRVLVSLPATALPPRGLDAAWQISHTLRLLGHKITFTTAPSTADIAIVDATRSPNVYLTTQASQTVLAIAPPYSTALLSRQWLALARGSQVQGGFRSVPSPPAGKPYVTLLSSLGFQDGLHETSGTTDWSVRIRADQLPARYSLSRVRLNILSAPSPSDHPTAFDVYLNGTLIQASRLANTGQSQGLDVALPSYLVHGDNTLRFVAMRTDSGGNCQGSLPSYPIQILPDSTLTAAPDFGSPAAFADLPSYFAGPFSVYLSRRELAAPARTLLLLSRLSADLAFDPQNAHLRVEATNSVPTGAFIWLKQQPPPGFDAPVRFDRGEIEALTSRGRELLETGHLRGIAVAQLLVSGQQCGLWIRTADDDSRMPVPRDLFLDQGDIAFFDQNEVLLDLDSRHPDLARIAYPAYQDWFSLIGAYRYWIFAVLWILLTAGAVSLLRRMRKPLDP